MIRSARHDSSRKMTGTSPGASEIGAEALARLGRSGYTALRDVRCEVRGGCLRLAGRLTSHYLKQVAQAVVSEVEGVGRVENLVEVGPRAEPRVASGRKHSS